MVDAISLSHMTGFMTQHLSGDLLTSIQASGTYMINILSVSSRFVSFHFWMTLCFRKRSPEDVRIPVGAGTDPPEADPPETDCGVSVPPACPAIRREALNICS